MAHLQTINNQALPKCKSNHFSHSQKTLTRTENSTFVN